MKPIILQMQGKWRARWWVIRNWPARRRDRKQWESSERILGMSLHEYDEMVVALRNQLRED